MYKYLDNLSDRSKERIFGNAESRSIGDDRIVAKNQFVRSSFFFPSVFIPNFFLGNRIASSVSREMQLKAASFAS